MLKNSKELFCNCPHPIQEVKKDYGEVRKAIESILDVEGYDDGSYGPLLVRCG